MVNDAEMMVNEGNWWLNDGYIMVKWWLNDG